MDEFSQRLKDDAASIRADVSKELEARIESSIHATERVVNQAGRNAAERRNKPLPWWLSGLTGLVAAVLIIALLNRNTVVEPVAPLEKQTAMVVPEYVRQLHIGFLKVENADFTGPLENELELLKSDIEKARKNIEQDLVSAF